MSDVAPAALMLSIALMVTPASPRRRITRARAPHSRVPPVGAGWFVGLAGCFGVIGAVLLPPTTILGVAVLGATASLRCRRRHRDRRAGAEARALEAALEALVGELRAGAHPVHAFGVAADDAVGSVAAGLRGVAARARLGADVAAGLRAVAEASELPGYWERLAVCWELAGDHGLAIAAVMRAAQRDIAERQRFSAKLVSGMAGARASAVILAGLPALGVMLGQLIGAKPLSFLLGGSTGGWLLVAGSTLVCAGLLWSDRITALPALGAGG